MGKLPNGTTRRYLESLVGTAEQECITWPFAKLMNGYGAMNVRGTVTPAHRVMCLIAHGEPPSQAHLACHSCGNGHLGCVNPNHVRWGTAKDNVADTKAHGTIVRGSRSNFAKLSEDDVLKIREIYAAGRHTQRQIAHMFNVAYPTMHCIVHRKNWAWLD